MTTLTAKSRNALPSGSFALPGRRYPIHDESHARNALSRVSQNGTPEEKAKVRAAVHRKYPGIGQSVVGRVHHMLHSRKRK
jgi:hypothetical protein